LVHGVLTAVPLLTKHGNVPTSLTSQTPSFATTAEEPVILLEIVELLVTQRMLMEHQEIRLMKK
jgi:hypothetical protein